jgi:hypothetical protein
MDQHGVSVLNGQWGARYRCEEDLSAVCGAAGERADEELRPASSLSAVVHLFGRRAEYLDHSANNVEYIFEFAPIDILVIPRYLHVEVVSVDSDRRIVLEAPIDVPHAFVARGLGIDAVIPRLNVEQHIARGVRSIASDDPHTGTETMECVVVRHLEWNIDSSISMRGEMEVHVF